MAPQPDEPIETLTVDDLVDEEGAPFPPVDVDDPATWPPEEAPPA